MTNTKTLKGRCSKLKKLDRRMKSLLSDKRAISAVLSTLILTAGVIAAGIATLYWAYSWGGVANQQYSDNMSASMSAMEERIAFEYITYSSSAPQNLTVYIINCGQSNTVSIARVYLSNSTWESFPPVISNGTWNYSSPTLISLKDSTQVLSYLNVGDEGYFIVNATALIPGSYYTIHLVTQRGRNFDQQFATS